MVAPVAAAVHASLVGAPAPADAAATAERAQRVSALAAMDSALHAFAMVDRSSYYSGAWSTIASLTMSGVLTPPTFAAYNLTEAVDPPPPLTPPASPPSSPSPSPPTPPPPPQAPHPPFWHERAIYMTWSIVGGSLVVGVLFCCCACRCLHYRISTTHWRSQRRGWAQAEEHKVHHKSGRMFGSGRMKSVEMKSKSVSSA